MKHLVFATTADADAFIADLKAQNVVDSLTGTTSFRRQTEGASVAAKAGGDGKEIAGGALGTAAGAAAGAVNSHGLDDDAAHAVAVEDNIPADIVEATATRHNGRFV